MSDPSSIGPINTLLRAQTINQPALPIQQPANKPIIDQIAKAASTPQTGKPTSGPPPKGGSSPRGSLLDIFA